jgi:DNA-binding response OmpR family regulator
MKNILILGISLIRSLGKPNEENFHWLDTDSHYLRVYIGHLRKKIEIDPARPNFIITEPGIGYRFMTNT